MLKHITLIRGIDYDSNIYIIDGEIIVDTGTRNHFLETKSFIKEKFDINKLKTIVNTHCHYDHVAGNKKFRDWLGARVMIHENDADAIENGTEATVSWLFQENLKSITVDRKLKDKDMLNTENCSIEVIHTPGHTAGSICLYEKNQRILITGDVLFENTCGRVDFPTGNRKQMIESLIKIQKLNPKYILPGHGNIKSGGVDFLIKQILNRL